jgi:hypothetical protein
MTPCAICGQADTVRLGANHRVVANAPLADWTGGFAAALETSLRSSAAKLALLALILYAVGCGVGCGTSKPKPSRYSVDCHDGSNPTLVTSLKPIPKQQQERASSCTWTPLR